jgi:hypothetical protein
VVTGERILQAVKERDIPQAVEAAEIIGGRTGASAIPAIFDAGAGPAAGRERARGRFYALS